MRPFPRYAMVMGRRMEVLDHMPPDHFFVNDPRGDVRRFVHRSNMTFIKDPKRPPGAASGEGGPRKDDSPPTLF